MAAKLMKFYDLAKEAGGLPVQMRLAMATGVPSTKAGEQPDSPELIAKFKTAFKDITGKDAPVF